MLIRSHRDAERVACAWMQNNGHADARLTGPGPDGGVDVRSSAAVAQVKAETSPVGIEAVQRLLGVASVEQRQPLFFSLSGYTRSAQAFAERAQVPLFRFNLQSEVEAANRFAEDVHPFAISDSVAARLLAAAERVGITSRVEQEVPEPAEGLRAYPVRLASWIDRVADHAESPLTKTSSLAGLPVDGPGFALDLGGTGFLTCYADVSAIAESAVGTAVLVHFGGQLLQQTGDIDGLFDGTSLLLPTSDRDRLGRLAVGAVAEVTARCGARPEHLRLLPQRHGSRPSLVEVNARGPRHRRQARIPMEVFPSPDLPGKLMAMLQRGSKSTIRTNSSVLWRSAKFAPVRRAGQVTVRVLVSNRWEFDTPGPQNLKALVREALPEATIHCPIPRGLSDSPSADVVVIRVTASLRDAPDIVETLLEGLTLGADDLDFGDIAASLEPE